MSLKKRIQKARLLNTRNLLVEESGKFSKKSAFESKISSSSALSGFRNRESQSLYFRRPPLKAFYRNFLPQKLLTLLYIVDLARFVQKANASS